MTLDPNHDPASPLGYDADVLLDMFPDGRSCSGARLVGNALVHRLMADALPLIGAPGGQAQFGEDARKWVQECTTPQRTQAKIPRIVAALSRDPRVDPASIRVTITLNPAATFRNGSSVDLAIAITATTTTNLPIDLIIGISAVTVELLSAGT